MYILYIYIYIARMSYLSIVLVVIIILLVILVAFLIAYNIILQRSNNDYKERNSELEKEMKYCSGSCADLRSNYTDIYNKYILLAGINNELNSQLQANYKRNMYDLQLIYIYIYIIYIYYIYISF